MLKSFQPFRILRHSIRWVVMVFFISLWLGLSLSLGHVFLFHFYFLLLWNGDGQVYICVCYPVLLPHSKIYQMRTSKNNTKSKTNYERRCGWHLLYFPISRYIHDVMWTLNALYVGVCCVLNSNIQKSIRDVDRVFTMFCRCTIQYSPVQM